MQSENSQFVDPCVTQQKFEIELAKFLSAKEHYRKLGVLFLEESYPNLYFGFTAPALNPVPIVFAIKINFTNYDVKPLSVQFIHPLTYQPLKYSQIPTKLPRRLENTTQVQHLLQADSDEHPFFCIPGVREYHEHPYHTGDSWFLYRQKGKEGSLCFLLDNLHLYGTSHLNAYQFQIQIAAQNPNVDIASDPNSIPL